MGNRYFTRYVACSIHTTTTTPILSSLADNTAVPLQLPEHLCAYYLTWKDTTNERVSIALTNDVLEQICTMLNSHVSSLSSIPMATLEPLAATIRPPPTAHGQLEANEQQTLQWQLSTLLTGHCLACTEIQYHYGGCAEPPTRLMSTMAHQKLKCIAETSHTMDSGMDQPLKKPHKERSCTYCQSIECNGH